ncbi:DUF3042 family protein [Lactococcus protaetiae]|uniref:DUF3042 family protein n=1 Tax=Lactococcus protaetiae TaxID=2592653 RepID=A0A514Z885_9LACT|nr:DUF3042 family protein [Lactococcus protaetiae]MCL2114491.1 DUF3042 family protein [Streptococcaceae bacterium]QDK70802.1 DUF3042 family protein [Lactococcus protaetiae]
MNKLLKGYLIGKAIEITIAGTTLLIAKHKGYLPEMSQVSADIPNMERHKKAIRKRLAR